MDNISLEPSEQHSNARSQYMYLSTSPRTLAPTQNLSHEQAINLANAFLYSDSIGQRLNRHCVIWWRQAKGFESLSHREKLNFQTTLLDKATRYLKRNGVDSHYVWVREDVASKGLHTHLLIRLPQSLIDPFERFLYAAGNFSDPVNGGNDKAILITGRSKSRTLTACSGPMRYCLKTLAPTGKLPDGRGAVPVLRLRTEPSLPIYGKRCGTSQNLSLKARTQGAWHEVMTFRALDELLPHSLKCEREWREWLATPTP